MQELIELESRGWSALTTEGGAGRRFYASVLREDALMILPGDLQLKGRAAILETISDKSWDSFLLDGMHALRLGSDAIMLVYKATAQRAGSPPYAALIGSTYVNTGVWHLVVHQQTPI